MHFGRGLFARRGRVLVCVAHQHLCTPPPPPAARAPAAAAAVARVLLVFRRSQLPKWLEDSYLGRPQLLPDPPADANAFPPPQPRALPAPWKVFTPGSGGDGARSPPDPTALLDMWVLLGVGHVCVGGCLLPPVFRESDLEHFFLYV